jgi:hypothetical protein
VDRPERFSARLAARWRAKSAIVTRPVIAKNHLTTMKPNRHRILIGLAALCGGLTAWAGAAMARDVMLAPLLILHAPTTLVMLLLHSSSWLLGSLLGAGFYALFAASIVRAQSRTAKVLAAGAVVAFNVLSIMALQLAIPRLV